MEAITNKFTSLLSTKSQPQRHIRDRNDTDLPFYQQLPHTPAGSSCPSFPRSSSSTERSPHCGVHSGQPRSQTERPDFSSSSETLDSLGGPEIMASVPQAPSHGTFRFSMRLPGLKQFLSDFTLGFADGLTVPFALTAGLSSLGHTKTVIYAGMAEICAGSISMGIGGYLAAKGEHSSSEDELESVTPDDSEGQDEEEKIPLHKNDEDRNEGIEEYLTALNLPPSLMEQVLAHARLSSTFNTRTSTLTPSATTSTSDVQSSEKQPPSAILSGLSISLGYLLGGILPLFPYFFVDKVTDGLAWSFGVCVLALFFFGFGKAYALGSSNHRTGAAKWKRVKRSIWEGLQMVVLGSIAAGAAVVCVSAFEKFA
ncbi:VIT family domain containing protein [Naviculisporaceae sp. PSN 640]